MTGLLGPNGQPISSSQFKNKKVPPPATGEKYGKWAGEEMAFITLPGGGAIQFDLSRLTLADYRQMKDHYQINASLAVLTFLIHQMEWRIACDNKQQRDFYHETMENIWTRLVRAKSQAFWAGYSPNVLQWENDTANRRVVLDKVKDLIPEDCRVHWKKVDGARVGNMVNKIEIYDGIDQFGSPTIPVENSYWYPLLMDNGDYYGKKLLRPAFQSWFFSILLHLFANRYYERFGEPTPIGRAPYDDEVRMGGQTMRGNDAMELILQSLRSRATVVLPNDRTPIGDETNPAFDYQIEYLESQMRGADFERYMTRLDEEMSLALFTPILLMRTADVGSYNLGTQHTIIYQWMLNAIAGDWSDYINKYILRPLRDYNFGTNAPLPKIKFRRMGAQNQDIVNNIVSAMIAKGRVKPDIEQLGEIAGLSLSETKQLTQPTPPDPNQPPDPNNPPDPQTPGADPAATPSGDGQGSGSNLYTVAELMVERVANQAKNAFRKNNLAGKKFDIGYNQYFEAALEQRGFTDPASETRKLYDRLEAFLSDLTSSFEAEDFNSADDFVSHFRTALLSEIDRIM